jgi:hypothetical protein
MSVGERVVNGWWLQVPRAIHLEADVAVTLASGTTLRPTLSNAIRATPFRPPLEVPENERG